MTDQKQILLRWIEEDHDKLVNFLSHLIQAKSPNPPGDTRAAATYIRQFLDEETLPYKIVAPQEDRPNIIGSFECGGPGRHLVLNGHIDVFPVENKEEWIYDPWSGKVADGRIYGRGAADMKCGMASLIFAFLYLHRIRDQIKGRLTLTCVSDEESFGPWGARYLIEHNPEVLGDCFLSGDGPEGIVFGQKGLIWLTFTIHTRGCHGAYTHLSPNAIKIAAQLITDFETLAEINVQAPKNIESTLCRNAQFMDKSQGKGAADIVQKVTINIGTIQGGLKLNMIPGTCNMDVDIRLPIGLEKEHIMAEVKKIVMRYPGVSFEEICYTPPCWSDPNGEMVRIIQANIKALTGVSLEPVISLGGTDARLWNFRKIPAYLYAPVRGNMAAANEHVEIEELIKLVKIHVLSAYDYLTQ